MKNILVTGCAGFIGSHLCEKLVDENYNVVGLDNLSNGKISNLKSLKKENKFDFIEIDINDEERLNKYLIKTDMLFHLAALADIVPSITNPNIYFESNVKGTFNIMKLSREHCIKKIIYAASSSCYGIPDKYPTSENSLISPCYPYALTKRLGEEIIIKMVRETKKLTNSNNLCLSGGVALNCVANGKIVKTGDADLGVELEKTGYSNII